MSRLPRNRVLVGDALEQLRQLPDNSVDMALTSPPYFRLRDYAVDGQIGLEGHVNAWVASLTAVCAEIGRVLVPTGTLWLNLGDTYATDATQGAKPKSLVLAPEQLAIALQADGWILRNKIVWAKTNPMPTSARDRLACTHEVIYALARNPAYHFNLDSIRVPHRSTAAKHRRAVTRQREVWRGPNGDDASGLAAMKAAGRVGHPLGKNPGDVWHLATSNFRGGHHATFPVTLAARAIAAGCPEARCRRCRLPWTRRLIRALGGVATRATLGPSCDCGSPSEPGLVLDPFIGSGSTAVAAQQLQRDWLGIELNPDFAALAKDRIEAQRVADPRANPDKAAA
ncbi:site-specific DNA-methyltransferase [Rhodococcus spelaei]|uniref:Methyltransferase n=1 Tax=Rhodococcus spelaei TaxID=2546320 RepID=A0A541BM15_9NOCA|nr:site-specific DNA-methyltransferase [Rhodococcus spelaei]TQF73358.1 site-specific DNA-methyltransferase [Rhodococcus spelaei]